MSGMVQLWLDDIRTPPTQEWIWVKNYDQAVAYVEQHGLPDHISFDHDLGDQGAPTGYDFAKWLVNQDLNGNINLGSSWSYALHTANPVGRENIRKLLENYIFFKRRVTKNVD